MAARRLRLARCMQSIPQIDQLPRELTGFGAESREPLFVELGRVRRILNRFSELGKLLLKLFNGSGMAFGASSVTGHGY